MNKVIRQLGFGFLALYLILFGALVYWQVISTERLSSKAGNNRAILRQYERPRGIIATSDGVVVAQSRPTTDTDNPYQRVYPEGDVTLTSPDTLPFGSAPLNLNGSGVTNSPVTPQPNNSWLSATSSEVA